MNAILLRRLASVAALAVALSCSGLSARAGGAADGASFDTAASSTLSAMRALADKLHVSGVAVVSYAPGTSVSSWSSRMEVFGSMTQPATATGKGSNLLGVAYAKASEMASTLRDSGSGVRPVMTGEFGWKGGVIAEGKTGILIVAFSGGPTEDDLKISKAGLAVLSQAL